MDAAIELQVENPPETRKAKRPSPSEQEPKRLPPYAVVVFNDDEHTFAYVVETFMKVFGYTAQKSWLLALAIHHAGKGIVWSGPKEVAELKRDQIRSAGPDFYATRRVDFPLGVTIEPLPG
ncbi:MAG: ATP-dependent Clp protease adaptor ClpS [Thermoguttaceae bacterium]|jgi:ATP-dependent Clp protease adaptor protein ClpS|nr:ATP-dependent Clp protease adaptor ClpS [Thermoguttaceae bacterium]